MQLTRPVSSKQTAVEMTLSEETQQEVLQNHVFDCWENLVPITFFAVFVTFLTIEQSDTQPESNSFSNRNVFFCQIRNTSNGTHYMNSRQLFCTQC